MLALLIQEVLLILLLVITKRFLLLYLSFLHEVRAFLWGALKATVLFDSSDIFLLTAACAGIFAGRFDFIGDIGAW